MGKRILWLREWFDSHKKFYLDQLNGHHISENKQEKILWNFLKYAQTSAYGKGRQSGVEYTIKKYIKKDES